MIIGSEHGTIIWTIIVPIINSSMYRMIAGCKIRLTVRIWLIDFNTMLKVIKTWDYIVTQGVIKIKQKNVWIT